MKIRTVWQGETDTEIFWNRFTDLYLPEADGDDVKVYLVLFRIRDGREETLAGLAERTNLTEKRFCRSLDFWQKAGALKLFSSSEDEGELLVRLELPAETEKPQASELYDRKSEKLQSSELPDRKPEKPQSSELPDRKSEKLQSSELPDRKPEKPQSSELYDRESEEASKKKLPESRTEENSVSRRGLRERTTRDVDFQDLVHEFSIYMGKDLTPTQFEQLIYLYGELGMSYEVLHYLLDECKKRSEKAGKKYLESFRYFEKIALEWHSRGVRTTKDAKAQGNLYVKEYFQIMKEYGISTTERTINPYQKEYMDRWLYEYGFSMDIIREAIRRTFSQTKSLNVNYEYTNKMLTTWHEENVRTAEDISRLDEAHKKEKEAGREKAETSAPNSHTENRFHNFEQRIYDYDALMQQIRKE